MLAPDWVNGRRALKVVTNFVHAQGLKPLVLARLEDAPDNDNRKVLLSGYTVFDRAQKIQTLDWCLPRSAVSGDDLIGIFE